MLPDHREETATDSPEWCSRRLTQVWRSPPPRASSSSRATFAAGFARRRRRPPPSSRPGGADRRLHLLTRPLKLFAILFRPGPADQTLSTRRFLFDRGGAGGKTLRSGSGLNQ